MEGVEHQDKNYHKISKKVHENGNFIKILEIILNS